MCCASLLSESLWSWLYPIVPVFVQVTYLWIVLISLSGLLGPTVYRSRWRSELISMVMLLDDQTALPFPGY